MPIIAYTSEGIIAALLGVIIFLIQGRLTEYKESLAATLKDYKESQATTLAEHKETQAAMVRQFESMRLVQEAHSVSLAKITESQRAVVMSQTQLSGIHGKLVDDMEELEDASQQLQLSTVLLHDRMKAHDKFREAMEKERGR
jgi:uncharacterized protein YecA (UPF0149 family)